MLELFCLLSVVFIFLISHTRKTHTKWLESRRLAEYYRILTFSCLLDEPKIVSFGNLDIQCNHLNLLKAGNLIDIKNLILDKWLIVQSEYHRNKITDFSFKEKILKVTSTILYGYAVFLSATHMAHYWSDNSSLIFITVCLPALAATILAIRSNRDYRAVSIKSEKIKKGIDDLIEKSKNVNSISDLEKIITDAEILFITDVQIWTILTEARELELSL